LPAEHDELMAQHEQLDVFGELAAPVSDQQPQQSREGEIGERKQHAPMLPSLAADGSKNESLWIWAGSRSVARTPTRSGIRARA
jgi:hypothetical protein